ncbi:MAG: hypothetical protein FRX49_13561 [Trebouxia sp. A1-2]|nr:MAG: hypothetical protein FRX49_13561 [Trebouxia sp. A1-2]
MFGRIRAFGAQLATSVVFLTHIAVEKAADAGLAPPPVLVGAAVAVCGTSYVVKKIHRKNLHNRNNRRPSKQKTKQSRSYEAPYDAYDQPSQPTNTEEIFTPSSPVSPKAARHATLSSARSGPTRADRTPLTGTANGYICSDVSTPLPPLSPYSPTGSFATALTPLTEIPDNTDQPDDYDDADGEECELRRLQHHHRTCNTLANLNQPNLPPALSLDALVQRQIAARSASSNLSVRNRLQLTDGKENTAAIQDGN